MAGLRAASGENKDAMRALLLAHKSVDLACFDELQAYWSKFFFRISQVQKRKPAGASEAQYMAQKVAHARDSVLKIYDDLEALLKRANLDEISEHLVRGFIPVTIDLLSMEDRQMSSIEKF